MNPYRTRTIAVATALLTTLSRAAGAGQASPQSWRGAIAQGNVIEIKGVNGDVRAVASSGGEVEVSAVMKGRRNNPSEVRLEIVQHAEGVTVCAIVAKDGDPGSLDRILAAHSRIHGAEGALYRDVLREACTVPVKLVPPRSLDHTKVGKLAPPPWGRDQKLAALAAWSVLV